MTEEAFITRAAAQVQPYGTNDFGGFRNILPPGENGLDNAADFTRFQADGTYPPHFNDQLKLYTDLLYASPRLKHAQLSSYYKDATFGVKPEDVESSESPRAGVTIIRDKAFGVPHIYCDTPEDVEFGAGYAGLQPVEVGVTNLSLLIERAEFAAAGENWAGVQALLEREAPHMARRLRGARAAFERPVSIFRVPYGYVHAPDENDPPSVFRLGDQAVCNVFSKLFDKVFAGQFMSPLGFAVFPPGP